MPPFIPAQIDRRSFASLPGAFVGVGAGADVDAALDDAIEAAWIDFGRSGEIASVADADVTALRTADVAPAGQAAAVASALRQLHSGSCEPGVLYAVPVTRDSAFARRKFRVAFDDVDLDVGAEAAVLPWFGEVTEQKVLGLLAQTGVELADGEAVESIQVSRVRSRFKVTATAHKGKLTTRFAILDGATGQMVSTGHLSAVLARREAVAQAKALGMEQPPGSWQIVGVTGRPEGLPLATVTRARVAQKGALRVTVAKAKSDTSPVLAWLFFGVLDQDVTSGTDEIAVEEGSAA